MVGEVKVSHGDDLVLHKKNDIQSIASFYIASSMGFFPEDNYLLDQIIITYNQGGDDLTYQIPITSYFNAGDEVAVFLFEIPILSFAGTMTKFEIRNSLLQENFAVLDVPNIVKEINQSFNGEWKFLFS